MTSSQGPVVSCEGKIKRFEDLLVWQKSHALTLRIYKLTKDFPCEERYGLVSQMRRAAVSISANIVEGFRKRSQRDKINYYNIAQGSSDELKYFLILAHDLRYINDLKEEISAQIDEIGKMLHGLISAIDLRIP